MSLGVLVVGALEPEERPALESHLSSCPSCSAELAQLSVLPDVLRRYDSGPGAADAAEPAGFGERLRSAGSDLAALRRQRARRRRMGAAAGLVAASVAAVVLVAVRPPETGRPEAAATTAVATARPGSTVGARFVMRPNSAGTRLSASVHGVGPNQRCSLVAVGRSGRREVAASWIASYTGTATVEGTTSLPVADIARLLVTRPDGTALAGTGRLHRG